MRWEDLFDDLAAQADDLERIERASEIRERTRIESAALSLADRLAAAVGRPLRLGCAGGLVIRGTVIRSAETWLLLDEGGGRDAVVAVSAIRTVDGLGPWARSPGSAGQVAKRLGLSHALRAIARDRLALRVHLIDTPGAPALDGTIDRVGADFLELATHSPGEWRRPEEVRSVMVIPTAAVAAVRRPEVG